MVSNRASLRPPEHANARLTHAQGFGTTLNGLLTTYPLILASLSPFFPNPPQLPPMGIPWLPSGLATFAVAVLTLAFSAARAAPPKVTLGILPTYGEREKAASASSSPIFCFFAVWPPFSGSEEEEEEDESPERFE